MADLQKPRGLEPAVAQAIRRVGQALNRDSAPWAKGRLAENVRFEPNVETAVTHKLGRKPRGFIIVSARTAGPNIGTSAADLVATELGASQAKFLLVTSGTSPRILSLWFW